MESLEDNSLLFRDVSYTEPAAWFHLVRNETPKKTALVNNSPVSFADIEVSREMATSKDGTKVPLNIIRKKETRLDGNNPTLLYGYGGYGLSMQPKFDFLRRLWFGRCGVSLAVTCSGG